MKKKHLLLILALGVLLRFWRLGDFPALNADEAAIGYNAFSLIETGRDEHGNFWPIHFQSFNDFKPGLYFYLTVPFVKVFGLNAWSVRAPAAFLGVLTVYLVYLLSKELFKNEKIALASSLLLTISPWHIHFSRGAWEVNVATFFVTLGILFFLKALRNQKFYLFSFLAFVASFYTYHAARVIVPVLGLGLLFLYRQELKGKLKIILLPGAIALILMVPLLVDLTKGAVFSRAAGVGLFADPGPLSRINEQRGEHRDFTALFPKALHNKAVNYSLAFLENLGDHFHGEFLFLSGDEIQRNKVPETGQMYLFELFFVIVGIAAIIKKPKGWGAVILWLLVAPTAAALTFQSPHALRAHNLVIPLSIISGLGLVSVLDWLATFKKGKWLKTGKMAIFLVIFWSLGRYLEMYWVHMAKEYPYSSQYGVKELVNFVKESQEKYEQIVVTTRYDQPYILFLFYWPYPPEVFQKDHVLTARDAFGFSTVEKFDKFVFTPIDNWNEIRSRYPNSLIAGTEEEIPEEANIIKDIYGTNDFRYFRIVAN